MRLYAKKQAADLVSAMIERDRLCRSFILTGEKGVGKRTLAKYMAMQILCRSEEKHPCGKCKDCLMLEHDAHPDFIEIQPSGKSGNYKVEDLRPIVSDSSVASNEGGFKIYFLAGIDKALAAAQNILLKVFEEPPDHVIFIMTAAEKDSVLKTILSRAVVINVPLASKKECIHALSDNGFGQSDSEEAYSVCGGNIGACIDYLSKEGKEHFGIVADIAVAIARRNEYTLIKLLSVTDRELAAKMLRSLSLCVAEAASIKQLGDDPHAKHTESLAHNVRLDGLIGMYYDISQAISKLTGNASVLLTMSDLAGRLISRL